MAHRDTLLARLRARALMEILDWNDGRVPTWAEVRQFIAWSVLASAVAWAVVVMLFALTRAVGGVVS